MPTNLPPEYFTIEQQYRDAKSASEKLNHLEKLLTVIPKHKGTDKLRADWRKRLSKLKSSSKSKKNVARHESDYHINTEGGGQVIVIGSANTGKSSLVATLTNATPEISPAPHSTWGPTPGMALIEDVQVQLIDTPAISDSYNDPELIQLIRRADLVLLMVDITADPISQLEDCLAVLIQHKICPQMLKEKHEDTPGFVFIPFVVCVNKNDKESTDEDVAIFRELIELDWKLVSISVTESRGIGDLKFMIFKYLNIIRVYSKIPGKEVDLTAPFVLKKGETVGDFASKVHKDFAVKLKTARIWGEGVYDGQMVQREHILKDKNIVELHI